VEYGDRYEMVRGSDTSRGGMYLELWDRPRIRLALGAFYTDADGAFEFTRHRDDVPPDVEAWFQQEARRLLPPVTEAEAGTEPDPTVM
jgi:hypothetical protein